MTGRFHLIHGGLTRHLAIRAVTDHNTKALRHQIGNILWCDLRRNGQRFG